MITLILVIIIFVMPSFENIEINGKVYYQPQDKQKVFHNAILNRNENGYRDFLYGGAARGGKSYALRWEGHRNCLQYPRLRGLLIRSSFPELERTHLAQIEFDLPQEIVNYNQQKHVASYFNNSVLEFGYGTRREDFQQYLSAEYDFIMIDELTTIPFEFSYLLRSRLTASRKEFIPFWACATNPGSIAHIDVRNYFVKKNNLDPDKFPNYDPNEVFFIPATVFDNKVVLERDPGEVLRLKQLSKKDQQKFLYGNWDIYEGQFFDNWNAEIHVVKSKDYLSYEEIKGLNVLGGLDYGNVTVLLLGAKDYNDNVIIFDELYLEKISRSRKIELSKKFLDDRGLDKTTIIADTNMWIPDVFDISSKESPANDYLNAGIRLIKVSKVSPDNRRYRIACNDAVYDALDFQYDPETNIFAKEPRLKIYERCKHLIETLPGLVRDEKDYEDIEDGQNDHAYDAGKYLYMALSRPKSKPKDDRPIWLKEMEKEKRTKINNDFMAL